MDPTAATDPVSHPAPARRSAQAIGRIVPDGEPIRAALIIGLAAVGATLAIAFAEDRLGVADASAVYLVAVVAAATFGTRVAVGAAIGSFVLYDLLFVEPRFTLSVEDPREWLDLVLLLLVGVVVGRLAGQHADRATESQRRLREATALFAVSRTLATAPSTRAALPAIVEILLADTRMNRISIVRAQGGREVVEADGGGGTPPQASSVVSLLARQPGNEPARWVLAHQPPVRRVGARTDVDANAYRVRIEADGEDLGAIWASRPRAAGVPAREETRLLALAADQLGLALQRERLAADAKDADVARRGETLGRVLLESVSHDLRTPLATIRADAGNLADPRVAWTDDRRRAVAGRIDEEAQRLDGLVRNLLDLSRIEGGTLVPNLEAWELRDLVEPVLGRMAEALPGDLVTIELPLDLPPVMVDPVLLDQALANVLENAARYAPRARVTVRGSAADPNVELRVDDAGPGLPAPLHDRLFDRFYRVPATGEGSRRGLGIGLSVVRGAVEAMGGSVTAEPSPSGGLAIVLTLPAAGPGP